MIEVVRKTPENIGRAPKMKVMFICGHNAGRSQMGQAFFNELKPQFPAVDAIYEAISVGTRPGTEINPMVMQAMEEIGIDLSDASEFYPKGMASDLITTEALNIKRAIIACDDTCELPPEIDAKMEKWNLPDPHGKSIETVREVRDLTKEKVLALLQELQEELIPQN